MTILNTLAYGVHVYVSCFVRYSEIFVKEVLSFKKLETVSMITHVGYYAFTITYSKKHLQYAFR